jgi:hypothetical protein
MYSGMFDELFENPKLVGARIIGDLSKVRFGFDDDGMVCSHTAVILMLWCHLRDVRHVTIQRTISDSAIALSKNFSYVYLQAVLNSLVVKFYFSELMWDKLNFYPNQMKIIPVPALSEAQQELIGSMSIKLQEAERESDVIAMKLLRNQIDELVFDAYGLTDQERQAIRSWLPDLAWQ